MRRGRGLRSLRRVWGSTKLRSSRPSRSARATEGLQVRSSGWSRSTSLILFAVTNDLKLCIKYGRQNGVHVTPTVSLDGLVDPSISSSYSREDWIKYLVEKVGVTSLE